MELIETMGPVLIQHSELPAKSWSGKWAVIESCWCHLKAPQFNGMERSGADASVVAVPSEEPDYHRVQRVRARKADAWQSAPLTLPRLIIASFLLSPLEGVMLLWHVR
jgi:hypothetical protein